MVLGGMSIIKTSKVGWLISHQTFSKEAYRNLNNGKESYELNPKLFEINSPYKIASKSQTIDDTEVENVKKLYEDFYINNQDLFYIDKNAELTNANALNFADETYNTSGKYPLGNVVGANNDLADIKQVGNARYLFPENCKFYNKDIKDIPTSLQDKYDLVLLDPPWWNKYIRRKRKYREDGYNMLYNEELKKIPVENLLKKDGLVVVWCTNSAQHSSFLVNEILPKWGLRFVAKWYWVKVTKAGQPICEFSKPPRKQPFEQIILACGNEKTVEIPDKKIVVSVPSALHSHKPPLQRILEEFLPSNPECLEIFARYLLPNWTSYGNEVLRLQNECLYVKVSDGRL